jgi:hypothetical protein
MLQCFSQFDEIHQQKDGKNELKDPQIYFYFFWDMSTKILHNLMLISNFWK